MSDTQVKESATDTNGVSGDTLFKEAFYVVLAYASFFIMPPVVVFKFVVPNLTPMAGENIYILLLSFVFLMIFGVGLTGTFMNKARRIKYDGSPPMP